MEELVAEVVAVQASPAGAPVRVVWRGRTYQVMGRPIRWIDRVPWWTWTGGRLPQVVEQPMWTVNLTSPGDTTVVQADLSVTGGDWWQLERVRG